MAELTSKTINELPEATSIGNNDLFVVMAGSASKKAKAINALAKRFLLWTNSDPSTLSATTINVNLNGFDFVEIEWTNSGDTNIRRNFTRCAIGTESAAVATSISSLFIDTELSGTNSLTVMSRNLDVYLLGIVFGSGNMIYNGQLYTNWDNRAVPYRIWGIKN